MRAVDADLVHGGHHLVARHLLGAVQDADPGAARMIALIAVDLRVDDHGAQPLDLRDL